MGGGGGGKGRGGGGQGKQKTDFIRDFEAAWQRARTEMLATLIYSGDTPPNGWDQAISDIEAEAYQFAVEYGGIGMSSNMLYQGALRGWKQAIADARQTTSYTDAGQEPQAWGALTPQGLTIRAQGNVNNGAGPGGGATGGGGTGGGGTGGGSSGGGAGGGGMPTGGTPEQRDAFAYIRDILRQYDLPDSLGSWAWSEIISGASTSQVTLDLYQQQAFKDRFSGMELRHQAGLPGISVNEYISNERAYAQIMRAAGIPAGFWDTRADWAMLIGMDKSPSEVAAQVQEAADLIAPYVAPVRQRFADYYGTAPDEGALLAWALDPRKGAALVHRQLRSAQIGGAAAFQGLGLERTRAEALAGSGVDYGQAMSGFGAVANELGIEPLQVGAQERALSQSELENAAFFGDQTVASRMRRRAEQARSLFEGGGGIAASNQGILGLGTPGA